MDPAMLMMMAAAESETADSAAEAFWRTDPFHQQDVLLLTKQHLRTLMQSDEAYFKASLAELGQEELAFLTTLFEGQS